MVQTDTPSGTPRPKDKAPQDPQICPQCGHVLYECQCTNRWENEGGATQSPDDSAAS
jgi:hypothetical protein